MPADKPNSKSPVRPAAKSAANPGAAPIGRKAKDADRYSAPALDKGLDILELLAARPEGMSLTQISDALGRTPAELFRMLNQLLKRAYVRRHEPGGVYRLSLKLFELAHRFPPTARLLEVAVPAMRQLANQTEQSCHLAVLHGDGMLVVAQTASPSARTFSVRMGAALPLAGTASGRVLLAHLPAADREERILAVAARSDQPLARLRGRIEKIRRRGYEEIDHETFRGLTDVSAPVIGHGGEILAALTVPVLLMQRARAPIDFIREQVVATAAGISSQLGGPALPEGAPPA